MRIFFLTILAASLMLGWTTANDPAKTETESLSAAGPINWVSLDEALANNEKKKQKRMILIDFYTDWCGWCKRMDATTFQDAELAKYINENFYAVKFDAEQKGDVEYKGKTYEFKPGGRRGGTSGFAIEVASKNGRIGYPTLAILGRDSEKVETLPGYQTAKQLDARLKYYGEGYSEDFDFQTFLNMYDSPYPNK